MNRRRFLGAAPLVAFGALFTSKGVLAEEQTIDWQEQAAWFAEKHREGLVRESNLTDWLRSQHNLPPINSGPMVLVGETGPEIISFPTQDRSLYEYLKRIEREQISKGLNMVWDDDAGRTHLTEVSFMEDDPIVTYTFDLYGTQCCVGSIRYSQQRIDYMGVENFVDTEKQFYFDLAARGVDEWLIDAWLNGGWCVGN